MAVSLSNNRFSRVEIQSGLIGVGLINVEDRSGTLSLDKGHFKLLKAKTLKPFSVECTQSLTHTSCFHVTAADYNNIGKFLNRILGMEVQQQNALFQYFSDTLGAVIQEAKKNGRYDMGILGKTRHLFNNSKSFPP